MKKVLLLLLLPCVSLLTQEDQKVYKFTLKDAEEKFRKNNLLLLAAKFQIDAKRAGELQAKLYANPNIFLEQNVFNDRTDRYFDSTRNGQTVVQIQQLFLLGGKIDKRTKLAEINTKISQERFLDILRALKYELRSSFASLYYLRQAVQFYEQSTDTLRKTVENTEKAYQNRAILQAEVLRIKALLFFLENEKTDIIVQAKEQEASLRVLLNDPELSGKVLDPIVDAPTIESLEVDKIKLRDALSIAIENRPDLRIAVQSVKAEEANLALQKANAIPDLAFGPVYNRAGTYIPNYFGFTVQMNVPLFDRNQGNIEAAEKQILERRSSLENQRIQAENEVAIDLNRAIEKDRIYKGFRNTFTEEYKSLSKLMVSNYQKRYLTIIEFADFFETYRNSIIQVLKLQTERIQAIERLNYSVGRTIISIQPEAN
ncbi:MAG: TolC family protein [Leptospiraceae bacterium]|nr:TolC family protein [Leptospiraceae bacterium]